MNTNISFNSAHKDNDRLPINTLSAILLTVVNMVESGESTNAESYIDSKVLQYIDKYPTVRLDILQTLELFYSKK